MSVTTERQENGLLVITLNEPDRRNPVSHASRKVLVAALSEASSDDGVRAVVLTGAGRHFSAGGDIRDQAKRSIAAHRARFAVVSDMVTRMVRFPKPLVAAVEGWAAGGGFALALACPTVVASRQARFVASFTKIGLIPDMGLLSTLPARVGRAKARQLVLTNRAVEGPQAHELGIVDVLADAGTALETAKAQASEEADGAPLPRQFINDWFARDLDAALEYEQSIQPLLLNSEDAAEGRVAFAEKRPPVFRGG